MLLRTLFGCAGCILCLILRQNIFIGNQNRMVLLVCFIHTVDQLAFLESAMTHGSQTIFPAVEPVLMNDLFLIFRAVDIRIVDSLRLGRCHHQFLAFNDVLFLELIAEPLINLGLGLRTLYHIQPVTAGASGIL